MERQDDRPEPDEGSAGATTTRRDGDDATSRRDADEATATQRRSILAVTSCPVGIANTYMAADSLERAARAAGAEIAVETQGCSGGEVLTPEQIEAADVVIFAVDDGVDDRQRFVGLPVVESDMRRAIADPEGMVDEALGLVDDPAAATVGPDSSPARPGDYEDQRSFPVGLVLGLFGAIVVIAALVAVVLSIITG